MQRLSEEDMYKYKKLMTTTNCIKRHCVRIMLVGKESVGKTCLLKRLLKENIADTSSTDGVDIIIRRCKINIENGEWIIDKGMFTTAFVMLANWHAECRIIHCIYSKRTA